MPKKFFDNIFEICTLARMRKEKDDLPHARYLGLLGVPFLLVISPICGYFLGRWLDQWLNTSPYLSFVCLGLGIFAGIREFRKLIHEFGNDDKQDP